jgi:GTP cyclohydrolase I
MSEENIEGLARCYREIITRVGEDISREGLLRTPERAAKAMEFLTRGYEQSLEEIVNDAVFPSDNDEMVIVKDIELYPCASITCCPSSARLTWPTCRMAR